MFTNWIVITFSYSLYSTLNLPKELFTLQHIHKVCIKNWNTHTSVKYNNNLWFTQIALSPNPSLPFWKHSLETSPKSWLLLKKTTFLVVMLICEYQSGYAKPFFPIISQTNVCTFCKSFLLPFRRPLKWRMLIPFYMNAKVSQICRNACVSINILYIILFYFYVRSSYKIIRICWKFL